MSHDTASMAINYVQRGWYVIQLHDVASGGCSCGDPEPDHLRAQGGKHPATKEWQLYPLDNEARVRQAWARRPTANVGIATGPRSGIWVLDVDPDHGGDVALLTLIAEHGPLPQTYAVMTGSGGTHYYFAMPDWEVTNSRGRLPNGLDVRGRGGYVVAPPSTSGKGPYSVADDTAVAAAPAWLLELIRPRVMAPPAPGPPVPQFDPHAGVYDRAQRYATEGAQLELGELAHAPAGRRNETAFMVACRLWEFVNAPWSGIVHDQAWQGFLAACQQANTDGSFGYMEHDQIWRKAQRKVAGKQAELPPADWLGEVVAWGLPRDAVDFSAGPSGPIGNTAPSPASMQANQWTPPAATVATFVDPFADPGQSHGQGGAPTHSTTQPPTQSITGAYAPLVPMDPFEFAVQKAEMRIRAEREAKQRIKASEPQGPSFLDLLLTDEQLDEIPEPEPLVEGWLYRDSLARLWGPSGAGKSHVAVDLAASVATGKPWHGYATKQGTVVYIVAEGVSGMGKRRRAWQQHHGVERTGIRWLAMPVQVVGPQWERFVAEVATLRPALVVMDTQARVTVGVDENDPSQMGEVVDALELLRSSTQACCLLVHHTGTDETRARGATSVKGAMATELQVIKRQNVVTVRNPKQKDEAEAPDLALTLTPTGTSVVLVGATEARMGADGFMDPPPLVAPAGDRQALAMIEVMRDVFGAGQGGTKAEIVGVFKSHPSNEGVSAGGLRKIASRTWARLEGLGRIAMNPESRTKFKFGEVEGLTSLEANPDDFDDRDWPCPKPPKPETDTEKGASQSASQAKRVRSRKA